MRRLLAVAVIVRRWFWESGLWYRNRYFSRQYLWFRSRSEFCANDWNLHYHLDYSFRSRYFNKPFDFNDTLQTRHLDYSFNFNDALWPRYFDDALYDYWHLDYLLRERRRYCRGNNAQSCRWNCSVEQESGKLHQTPVLTPIEFPSSNENIADAFELRSHLIVDTIHPVESLKEVLQSRDLRLLHGR